MLQQPTHVRRNPSSGVCNTNKTLYQLGKRKPEPSTLPKIRQKLLPNISEGLQYLAKAKELEPYMRINFVPGKTRFTITTEAKRKMQLSSTMPKPSPLCKTPTKRQPIRK